MLGFRAEDRPVQNLLGRDGFNMRFLVRPPQRRYKWRVRQVNQLWSDIEEAIDLVSFYYLGPITIAPVEQGSVSIIDGQQRLATLSLLLASLRNELISVKTQVSDEETRKQVDSFVDTLDRLISRFGNRGERQGPVLNLQDSDQTSFESYAVARPGEPGHLPPGDPHSDFTGEGPNRIQEAMKAFHDSISTYKADGGVDAHVEAVMRFGDYCLENLLLVVIETPGEAEQAVVFDRSNSRGLPVTSSEQVKSALMARAGRVNPTIASQFLAKWDEMATRLETVSERTVDDFLRVFWLSTNRHVSQQAVYGALVSEIDKQGGSDPLAMVTRLNTSSRNYLRLIRPQASDPNADDLRDFARMRVVAPLPLLLAVQEAQPQHLGDAMTVISSLQIRNIIVGPDQANAYEKRWSDWAIQARNGEWVNVRNSITSSLLTDLEFKKAFSSVTIKDAATARYLLRKLEFHGMKDRLPPTGIDVEHVLPKSVGSTLRNGRNTRRSEQWIKDMGFSIPISQPDSNKISDAVDLLGNQTLWLETPNRSEQNSTFETKKARYGNQKENHIRMTRSLAKVSDWTLKRISERQQRMAQKALKVWPNC